MQRKSKYIIMITALAWMLGAVFIGFGGLHWLLGRENAQVPKTIYAAKSARELQKDVEAKQKQAKEAEAEKKQLEKEIAELESQKKDAASYISVLDEKLTKLTDKMDANREKITRTKKEIKKLRKELEAAKEEKDNQYDTMKKRIKYMYENGNQSYFELLFSSGSLSELFNRVEYISKVTGYDKKMLSNYQTICTTLAENEEELAEKLDVLQDTREALTIEKQSVDNLVEVKQIELREYQTSIADKNLILSNTEALLASQEEELEALMAAQREAAEKEAKEKEKQQNKKENTDSNTNASSTAKKGKYVWPLTVSGTITSYFGYRKAPTEGASTFHKGIDVGVPVGTGVLASNSGTVITATYSSSAGNYICISHGGGVYTYYMHLSSLKVSEGQSVKKGQCIALSGNTGISTGPHLHFAIYAGGAYVNPLNYVSR